MYFQEAKGSNICPASATGYSQPMNSKGWPWRAKSLAQGPQQVRRPCSKLSDDKPLGRNAACSKP